MPFKLKLKKSRQYNVTSKSLFVISVHHLLVLDTPTTVDCTLSSESTGQECLDNVCQRLSIQQPEFFGLRYVVKDSTSTSSSSSSDAIGEMRWVDLERPLSRQLEKYAASSRLHLRVMYYVVSGVSLIGDEIARNYYFLQLKSDVIDGRIACDQRQAVILAIYCRQAQYDSHQSERHTVDYLKTLLPFPRHMIEAGLLETLTEEVLQPNADIQKLTQASAEGLFIAACQQLDGYGQEKFVAKDDAGAEVVLGITVSGVAVTTRSGGSGAGPAAGAAMHEYIKFYPWHDISNVVNHKRTFNIECTQSENSVGFTLADADTGRYFWKLCVLQHTFYMKYEQHHNHLPEHTSGTGANANPFANAPEEPYDSRDNLFMSAEHLHQQQQQQLLQQANSGSSQQIRAHLYASDSHLSHHGGEQSALSSSVSLAASQQHLRALNAAAAAQQQAQQAHHAQQVHAQQVHAAAMAAKRQHSNSNWALDGSQMQLHQQQQIQQQQHQQHQLLNGSSASLLLLTHAQRAQSSSCLDLSNNNTVTLERERLKALLPGYRPAPDYETAVHQKFANSETELRLASTTPIANATAAALMLSDPSYLNMYSAGSQPDVHRTSMAGGLASATSVTDAIFGKQLLQQQQQQYPDVAQTANSMYQQQQQQQQQQHIARMHSMHVHQQQQLQQHQHQQHHHLAPQQHYANAGDSDADRFSAQLTRFNKPPPPSYAGNRLSSTSTPDLAVASASAHHRQAGGGQSHPLYGQQRGSYVSGSSPDLVSTRTYLAATQQQQYMKQHQHGGHLQQQQPLPPVPAAAARYRYSQPHIAHGGMQYENLNAFQDATHQLHAASAAAAAAHVEQAAAAATGPIAAFRQQPPPQQYANGGSNMQLQLRDAGSCEPIYENVPLPRNTTATGGGTDRANGNPTATTTTTTTTADEAMRNRTSSIQSAPGVMRFNQKTPGGGVQTGSMNVLNGNAGGEAAFALNMAALSLRNGEDAGEAMDQRVGSGGGGQPVAVHRSVSKTSSNPIYLTQQQQQQQQHKTSNNNMSAEAAAAQRSAALFNNTASVAAPLLNSSQSSAYTTATHDSGISSSFSGGAAAGLSSTMSAPAGVPAHLRHALMHNSSSLDASSLSVASSSANGSSLTVGGGGKEKKEKTKRRWAFFSGSKSSLNASSSDKADKQKSATLGRPHKEKASKSALTLEEESNLRHRWSTGLPRTAAGPEPVQVTQMSKEKLCQILETKLCDPQLYVEFECIPKRKEHARYECALQPENRPRNTDPNFLPYDDNRVHLTPQRDNRHGYANASHVSATVGQRQRFYVVAQSPTTAATLETFLQCVWEADVYLLVQLSSECNYVPQTGTKCLEYGQYQVWQEFSQVTDRCTTSKLRLYHTTSRRYRSVWHLSYTEWVEPNCPRDVGHFLDFLEELNSVRLAAVNEVPPGHNCNPPVMIHCSEGGGRSGITLAADLLLYTLDHNQDLDIPRVVSQLRHQRDNIIPALAQYKFMYALLAHYLKRTRLI